MFKFKDLSIQYKLILISLIISGIILFLSSTVFVLNDIATIRGMMARGIQVKARIIAYNSIAAMRFNDQDDAGTTLAGLRADRHIISARIYAANGQKFVSYQKKTQKETETYEALKVKTLELFAIQEFKNQDLKDAILRFNTAQDLNYLPEELRHDVLALIEKAGDDMPSTLKTQILAFLEKYDDNLPATLQQAQLEFSATRLTYSHPVESGDERLGMVLLVSDLDELYHQLFWYFLIVALVIIGSILIAFFLSARMQKVIATPLLTLARLARQVSSQKDYSLRAEHHSQDELGTLFRGFNDMLGVIQQRDEQLAKHRDDLEKTVALRTAELKRLNTQLTYQAYHDALTNLPNRAMYVRQVEQSIVYAKNNEQALAVLFLDLDHFKYINDTLGHAAGDRVLQEVAKRLLSSTRQPEDTVARLGGDEFTILLRNIKDPRNAIVVAKKILKNLIEPFRFNGQELHISSSIGISLYPENGTDVGSLMRSADSSMYSAKQRGRNTYAFYTEDSENGAANRLHMESKLRHALEEDEFEVWYQPRFDLKSGKLIGAEALVRWRSPDLNLVSPAQFIPLAEDTGLIIPIGEWVLRTACKEALLWHEAGHPLDVSVNLSARQFAQEDLLGKIDELIKELQMPAKYLELELTESLIMPNADDTIEILASLKELGVKISIDDFGTGYSSLSYLKRFPIDILKIDQSFMHGVGKDTEDVTLVTAIIAMAHKLGLTVVAEGVETPDQLTFLINNDCDYVQGYLPGKPMPTSAFRALLARGEMTLPDKKYHKKEPSTTTQPEETPVDALKSRIHDSPAGSKSKTK